MAKANEPPAEVKAVMKDLTDDSGGTRTSIRKKLPRSHFDPSAGSQQPQLAPCNKKTKKEPTPPPAKKETTKEKTKAPPPPAAAKNKGGRPSKAALQAKAALESTTKGGESAIETAALTAMSHIKKLSETLVEKVKPAVVVSTSATPTPAGIVVDQAYLEKQEELRIEREQKAEDRMFLHDQRQQQLRTEFLSFAHQCRMEEQALQAKNMLANANLLSNAAAYVTEIHHPRLSSATTQEKHGKESRSSLKLTKAMAFCVKWLKENGYESKVPDGSMPADILDIGLKVLGNPTELGADIANVNEMRDKINLLVDAFNDEDEE